MGLSVVYGIIREHKGAITVKSIPGQGTTFKIILPCVCDIIPTKEKPSTDIIMGTGRILFVDDEDMLVSMGCQMLEKMGYEVFGFNNPTLALKEFTRNPDKYDLVISDFTMPNLTGLDLAKKLNALRPDLPIVILTGHLDNTLSDEAALHGVVNVSTKPLSFKSLNSVVIQSIKSLSLKER